MKPQRKSPRLQGYDYTQEGAYFITICVQNRRSLFGKITENTFTRNAAGDMVTVWWEKLPEKFPDIELDEYIVMPNHFHGIVVINQVLDSKEFTGLPDVMRWFKTMTTNDYIRGVQTGQWERFEKKLWQRSYHDHIIRNEQGLKKIRDYIVNNPQRWQEDTFYSDM